MYDITEYTQLPIYQKFSLNINLFVLDLYFSIKHFICKSK